MKAATKIFKNRQIYAGMDLGYLILEVTVADKTLKMPDHAMQKIVKSVWENIIFLGSICGSNARGTAPYCSRFSK